MKANFMKPRLFYSILLLFCLTETAQSQSTGSIKGSITDHGKMPLPHVNIVLEKTNFHTTTNDKGEYVLDNIPPGGYLLEISHIGYQAIKRDISVRQNETVEYSYSLQTSTTEIPSVEVYGESRFTNVT